MKGLTVFLIVLYGFHQVIPADATSPTGVGTVLRPRLPAPAFVANAVHNDDFTKFDLTEHAGKWVVLMFYPFDFTFVCPTELVAFSEAVPTFKDLDTEVAAISTDSHFTHLAWIKTPRSKGGLGKINLPLVADISKEISRSYGVLVEDPEDSLYGAALRAIFIIDPKGIIRSVQVNDESVGRSVQEVVRLVQAFQYADSHGEGCPANWHPGDDTIKPNPNDSQEYFAKWSKKHTDTQ